MSLSLLRPAGQRGVGLRSRRFSSSCTSCSRSSLTHRSSNATISPVIRRRQGCSPRTRCAAGGPADGVDGKGVSGNGNTSSSEVERQPLAEPVGEDDVSPLRNALKRAMERKEKAAEYRVSLEHEAQDVAQLAVRETELLAKAEKKLGDANREVEQAEAQLASVRAKTDLLEKLLAEASEAAEPASEGEKAAEEDDEGGETSAAATAEGGASKQDQDAASNEKTAAAAAERSAVATELYTQLTACQEVRHTLVAKLLELRQTQADRERSLAAVSERSLKAEKRASLVMQEAQNAFQDEMEAEAVVEQIRLAFQKASEQLEAMETCSKPKTPAPKKPEPVAAADADSAAAPSGTNGADASKEESTDAAAGAAKAAAAAVAATAAAAAAAAAPVAEKPGSERAAAEAGSSKAGSSSGTLPARLVDPAVHLSVKAGKKLDYRLLAAVVAAGAAAAVLLHHTGALSAAACALTDRLSALPMVLEKVVAELLAGEEGLLETIALLFTSVLSVPLVLKFVPGGSAVLGFLLGGAAIGPHALGLIKDVEQIKHLAELGVVFLLFNIGLELSLERLQSLAKYVFGLGNLHFLFSLAGIAAFTLILSNVTGPGAIILGGALALSSTAVAMQVLADRGESGAKHGRATFAVLLLQDLVVVVMLMLVPLLASGGASVGLLTIVKALSVAGIKAALCIAAIIAGGRVVLRPIYRRISTLHNAEIFAATTLLLVLGTSVLTQLAGLSLALGAFLAGLSVAETEYALQVESDIAPFKGLLMGLFFMSVGMEISMGLLIAEFRTVGLAVAVLLVGKTAVMAALGPAFGLSRLSSVRSGLYLAPGGEFAFVILGDAVSRGVLPAELVNVLFISVVLSMALTPYLAMFGSWLGKRFESKDMMALQPKEQETAGMRDHIVIAGFGRVGQVIAQVLSDNFIPYVAVDVRSDRVAAGKEADLPVYFGDAGSPAVLHAIGTHRAKCAVVTLDTPGGNYRTVWAISKNFPNVKIYCRAHDVDHGVNLEKAGATVVVPETLEPSLQLAAAILGAMNMSRTDVIDIVDSFRDNHMSELAMLSKRSGSSLGYGYDLESTDDSDTSDEEPESEERPDPEVDSIAGERGQLAPAT